MGLDEARVQSFLATKDVVVLATVQATGAPLAMPMWFLHEPAALTMISVGDTQKVRNIRRDGRVCVVAEAVGAGGDGPAGARAGGGGGGAAPRRCGGGVLPAPRAPGAPGCPRPPVGAARRPNRCRRKLRTGGAPRAARGGRPGGGRVGGAGAP